MTPTTEIATALAGIVTPAATKPKIQPEFYLDVVVRSGLDVSIADAITGGELERTMEGASTLTLTLFDPHRALLRNPDLSRAIDMYFGGCWWRLVKLSKSGDNLTLTFEDRAIAYLRKHNKARKAARSTLTRAQFIRQLVREVGQRDPKSKRSKNRPQGQGPITFVCPELKEVQPIGDAEKKKTKTKTPAKRKPAEREEKRQAGIPANANLTVKGARATPEQKRNGERVLDIADELGAGPKATKALLEAVIVESQIKNLNYGHLDSLGILQVRVSTSGSVAKSKDIEWCVTRFLRDGFYDDPQLGSGGAMDKARKNPGASAGRIAQATQGSGVPDAYDKWADEADKWLDAYGGASGSDTGGTAPRGSTRSKKKYEFRRGEPGKREDSWTAIQRLADEVGWHAFMDRGKLYYVSDDYLMRQKARFIVGEADDGIQGIDFDIDQGKVSSDVTVTARADTFRVPVGCVMAIRDCGLANGRYVVTTVRQSVYDYACDITLRAPTPKLPEPEAETVTKTGSQGGDGTTSTAGKSGSLRDKIVDVAKASMAVSKKNPGAFAYSQSPPSYYQDPTKPKKPGTRSDCSHWICCVYKKAGAPPPGSAEIGATGTMWAKGREVPLSQARPGDVILYGPAPSHHVELFVGPGAKTIGHGSDPVDEGTVGMMADPHCYRYDFLDD